MPTFNTLDIPKLLKATPAKSGLAFLSACKGSSAGDDDCIENCTAISKMRKCLEKELGYVVITVGENVTKSDLISLIEQVRTLVLPKSFSRIIYYHFGHGDHESIKVADGFIKRSDIITCFQSLGGQESNVFKIFIFDSCRVAEISSESIYSSKHWISGGQYPSSTNTLVIDATEWNFKAYYEVTSGCGLMTHFFTEFAPTRNESIWELLVSIRNAVVQQTQQEDLTQMLVYEDKLMGKCNLLAESQGTGKIVFPCTQLHFICFMTFCLKAVDYYNPCYYIKAGEIREKHNTNNKVSLITEIFCHSSSGTYWCSCQICSHFNLCSPVI